MSEHTAAGISARTAAVLLVFTIIFTALMAGTYRATRDIIAASEEEQKLKLIGEVLPAGEYDNDLLRDFVEVPPSPGLGMEAPSRIYRASKAGAPVAMVLEAIAPDGYSGAIRLVVAVRASGELAAARVAVHRETPGLGDYIDIRKDRNKRRPWITQFDGLGFARLAPEKWKVKKDGGGIDYVSGATVSARAVTAALRRALEYATANSERIFAAPNQSKL